MTQSSPPQTRDVPRRPADLLEVIRGRRSVRHLRPDPVPRAVVEEAIAAAGWAPSPHGRQPWRFVVIEGQERKSALADAMASAWKHQLSLDGQGEPVVQLRLAKSQDRVRTAPTLVLACLFLEELDTYPDPERARAEETMAIQSLGAAIQNMLLAIYAAGYDSGWMCAPLFCPEVVRQVLGLPDSLIPHALFPIGTASSDPVRRPRRSTSDLIHEWL